MTADHYLWNILQREQVDNGLYSPVRNCQQTMLPLLQQWGGGFLVDVMASGSFAKGTANKSGTDIDLFVSLSETTPETLKDIYTKLARRMEELGFKPRLQNVSIGIKVGSFDVDLVPAKRQNAFSLDHSLYRRRADTWTKTNIAAHIALVSASGCTNEIRIIKLWRDQRGLDFPSFYLELTVIEALRGRSGPSLSANVWTVLQYLRDRFASARFVDPSNTNNILSDELSDTAQRNIATAAGTSLGAKTWGEIVR
ncbi:Nucleotidyltransferase domain-containing protein [Ensifer adhaerens]|nr:Nucleotidyltransferase domain-containing protein [Ensifer adhaerens]